MSRAIPLLAGVAVVLGTGLVHGLWTQRWSKSADLGDAVGRLASLPEDLGDWKGGPGDEDRESLAAAGAEGWWIRRFQHQRSGARVEVLLLCGPGGRLCVHRPEHCYRGAGYDLAVSPTRFTPAAAGKPAAEFWTACFTKEDLHGPVNLRIFWSWFGDGAWQAPGNPRWSLAHLPALYKLYVIREVPPGAGGRIEDEPAADFLGLLVPALTGVLHPQHPEPR
jgi:hypothetical protein